MHTYKAIVTRVVDGDTLDCDIDLGFYMQARVRVRLLGIDTPEVYGPNKHPMGIEASAFVRDLMEKHEHKVTLQTQKTGKYGRWLAQVWCGDENLNDLLVKNGLAEVIK